MQSIPSSPHRLLKVVGLLVLLAFAPVSIAEVFKCVDAVTGKMAFTDHACPNNQPGQHHSVGDTNSDSGYDSDATSRAEVNRNIGESEHRQNWQGHNAVVANQYKSDKHDREARRNQVVPHDENDLGIHQSRDPDYDNDTNNNSDDVYKRVTN